MSSINASASGQLRIGDITINRLGYGAMRITGPGVWGAPTDRNAALATLRRLPELGVNFVDTADSYGPNVSEELIREAVHPYAGLLVATKAGFTRQGPGRWTPHGDPALSDRAGQGQSHEARRPADRSLAASSHRPSSTARPPGMVCCAAGQKATTFCTSQCNGVPVDEPFGIRVPTPPESSAIAPSIAAARRHASPTS
jgi:hypothetical protein